jgi:hypothetical protein
MDKMESNKQSAKFLEARNTLPEEMRPIYDQMVEEYSFYALKHYGRGWVAYMVIAELVRSGWRSNG